MIFNVSLAENRENTTFFEGKLQGGNGYRWLCRRKKFSEIDQVDSKFDIRLKLIRVTCL
jgi:hypothetical protein